MTLRLKRHRGRWSTLARPRCSGRRPRPGDLDQRIAILEAAAEHGTTDIVAASRASFEYPFDPAVIAQRVAEIKSRLDGAIRIHTGCAFHFGLGNIRNALANPHK